MNVYSGQWTACTKHDVFTSARVLNCSEVTYMGYQHNTHASNWSAIFQIWRESKYWSLKMCDFVYVMVHTQAQQPYVTVHSLLLYYSHMHF